MTEAAAGIESAMTAVLGFDKEPLEECCREASDLGCVQICNYNCPGQIVIGGEAPAVAKASALAKERGAKRCMPLKVSGPFHTALMHPAGDALAGRFKETTFSPMDFPVLFNSLGHELADEELTIPALLEKQVQSAVYMEQSIRRLEELGVDTIIEIGPGKALSGFVRKTTATPIRCIPAESCADLAAIIEEFGQ